MDVNQTNQESNGAVDNAAAPEAKEAITDIGGISKFSFGGEEYTPERLSQIFGEHKSWSEQVKEYEKVKEFEDNLEIDIENVLNDPRLAPRFKQVYPQKYHFLVDRFLSKPGQTLAQTGNAQTPALPKEFLTEFNQLRNQIGTISQKFTQTEIDAANAKMDAIFPKMLTKFPLANEDQVLTKAEAMLSRKEKVTDAVWERLFRESHEGMSKRADQFYGTKMKSQIDKGQRGKDSPAGGGVPGMKPNKPRTFDEAREAMLASLQHKSG